MDKNAVSAFIQALNSIAVYVPPILFERIEKSPISRQLEAIAQGMLVVEVKPDLPTAPPS